MNRASKRSRTRASPKGIAVRGKKNSGRRRRRANNRTQNQLVPAKLTTPLLPQIPFQQDGLALPQMVKYCFDVLHTHFTNCSSPSPLFPDRAFPLFVSWTKNNGTSEPRLRGCIGTFTTMSLYKGLQEYALISALKDSRFPPIEYTELPDLHCSVSLLIDFEETNDVFDWDIGCHGVWVDFVDLEGEQRSATFLPEVAVKQGWSKEDTLRSLIQKAGAKKQNYHHLLPNLRLTRYKTSKFSMSYDIWRPSSRCTCS